MVRGCKQVHVLIAGLVIAKGTTHGLLVSTKHMTGFAHEYLPLVSDYSRVLSTQQDSLTSIYHSSVIIHEYKI